MAEEVVVVTGAEWTHRSRAVFVSDFVDMNLPFEELAALFLAKSGACMGICPDNAGDSPAVTMVACAPRVHDESVIVPITWQPGAGVPRLSTIEADLRLTSLGGRRSRAALSGRYRVALPCSAVEFISTRHLAESWLRSFLEQLEATLRGQLSTPTELKGDPGGQAYKRTGPVVACGSRVLWPDGTGLSALVGTSFDADHGDRVRGSRTT